jgi:hypothetical protein
MWSCPEHVSVWHEYVSLGHLGHKHVSVGLSSSSYSATCVQDKTLRSTLTQLCMVGATAGTAATSLRQVHQTEYTEEAVRHAGSSIMGAWDHPDRLPCWHCVEGATRLYDIKGFTAEFRSGLSSWSAKHGASYWQREECLTCGSACLSSMRSSQLAKELLPPNPNPQRVVPTAAASAIRAAPSTVNAAVQPAVAPSLVGQLTRTGGLLGLPAPLPLTVRGLLQLAARSNTRSAGPSHGGASACNQVMTTDPVNPAGTHGVDMVGTPALPLEDFFRLCGTQGE